MKSELNNLKPLLSECRYQFSRSGGKGGQSVNKVSSKATLFFSLNNSWSLNEEQKKLIEKRLHTKLNADGELFFVSQKHRTQLENKMEVQQKFLQAIHHALLTVRKRKPTAPSEASKQKRVEEKKQRSEVKSLRKKISDY